MVNFLYLSIDMKLVKKNAVKTKFQMNHEKRQH